MMKKIQTLIVDDEPLARQTIRLLLQTEAGIQVVGECGNGAEAVKQIRRLKPDLVFLDVQMPLMSGFDVLSEVGAERMPTVIFVTAFDQYAIRAFEVNALDYLLKPFDDDRFAKALGRARAQIEQQTVNDLSRRLLALVEGQQDEPRAHASSKSQPGATREFLNRLMLKESGRVFFLKVEEIDWIEAADYYVRLHVGRKSHLMRESMNELEARLDPQQFLRIHRSTIVNIDRVKEMQPYFNGDYVMTLRDGTQLRLSRSRRAQVQEILARSS